MADIFPTMVKTLRNATGLELVSFQGQGFQDPAFDVKSAMHMDYAHFSRRQGG